MQNYSKVAGILSIISGAFGILGLGWMIMSIFMLNFMVNSSFYGSGMQVNMFNIIAVFYLVIGIGLALLGILGITGGIFALKRTHWGLALAGSIAAAITFFPCGIAAIIYTTKSQPEFVVRDSTVGTR